MRGARCALQGAGFGFWVARFGVRGAGINGMINFE